MSIRAVGPLLLAPQGRRDWPLRFYSRELLLSREARLGWVEPNLAGTPGPEVADGAGGTTA